MHAGPDFRGLGGGPGLRRYFRGPLAGRAGRLVGASVMSGMSIRGYAKAREVPVVTVHDAIRANWIIPGSDGLIDPDQADAEWLSAHAARLGKMHGTEAARQRMLDAAAIAALAEISRSRRLLAELQRSTAPRALAEAAEVRRAQRLQAALAALPALCAPAAAALHRPARRTEAVLRAFAERLQADLASATPAEREVA